MPELEPKDIQALVWGGEIVALTLDANIFDQFQCNLDNKSLAALGQFKGTKIKVLLSPIILGEVRAHIARKSATQLRRRGRPSTSISGRCEMTATERRWLGRSA